MQKDSGSKKPTTFLDFYVGQPVNLALKVEHAIDTDGSALILAGVLIPHPSGDPSAYALINPGGAPGPDGQPTPPVMAAFRSESVALIQAPIPAEALAQLLPGEKQPATN